MAASIPALDPILEQLGTPVAWTDPQARIAGMNHPDSGMPNNVAVFPKSVDPGAQPPFMGLGNFAATGSVGGAYAPFIPGGEGDLLRNLRLTLSTDRLDDRRQLLRRLDQIDRIVELSKQVSLESERTLLVAAKKFGAGYHAIFKRRLEQARERLTTTFSINAFDMPIALTG